MSSEEAKVRQQPGEGKITPQENNTAKSFSTAWKTVDKKAAAKL